MLNRLIKAVSLLLALVMVIGLLPITASAAGTVTNYADFLTNLKQLEVYAAEFSAQSGEDSGELVLNFIRTGVERYQTGTWETLDSQPKLSGFQSLNAGLLRSRHQRHELRFNL